MKVTILQVIGCFVAMVTIAPFLLHALFSYWTWIFDFLERKRR